MRPPPRPTRRTVLLLGATATASACTRGDARPVAAPSPPVDPDDALRDAAAARERSLLREYDGVLLALPELAGRLLLLRRHHAEHLLALVGPPPSSDAAPADAAPADADPAGTDPAETSPPAPADPAVPPPGDAAAALARLRAAEHAAGDGHARDCLLASQELAGVLASLSASEHSHPVALA